MIKRLFYRIFYPKKTFKLLWNVQIFKKGQIITDEYGNMAKCLGKNWFFSPFPRPNENNLIINKL